MSVVRKIWCHRMQMSMLIPLTDNSPVLRSDYSNQAVWEKVRALILKPSFPFGFRANVSFIDDPRFEGITPQQIMASLPQRYPFTYIFVVDSAALNPPHYPVLVIDLFEGSGQSFRATPRQIQAIENNISIANMDFEEFAAAVDSDGIFRGFRRR